MAITAGILLIAFNSGSLSLAYKPIIFSWQMLLIAMGFAFIFAKGKRYPGIVLLLIGSFFLLPKLDIPRLEWMHGNSWAFFLILIGIFILVRLIFYRNSGPQQVEKKKYHHEYMHTCFEENFDNFSSDKTNSSKRKWEEESGYIDSNYVFGGSKEKVDSKKFKGGEINCVFGEIELDLSDAHLAEGVNILQVSTVFGCATIYVPSDWNIEVQQSQIFGHFEDKRPKANFEIDENRVLIIKASSIFGGGEVKCK
jgi:predicted membrane protein